MKKQLLYAGVLFFSGLQLNLAATDFPQTSVEKKDILIQDEEGSKVQIKSDGTKTIEKADGTVIQVNPDGSKFIKKPDGTTIQVK